MKRNLHPARRVSALLLGAAALYITPALAQDVPAQQAAPPPAAEAPPAAPEITGWAAAKRADRPEGRSEHELKHDAVRSLEDAVLRGIRQARTALNQAPT